ncbi:RNA polymerase sigma factor [Gracilimonas sp. Q87]|uniref:RNA polymerase sigma factor n=1 Tax=Gracilimonas sp. Q87 TaxID=3384766 RepID=UPI003984575C
MQNNENSDNQIIDNIIAGERSRYSELVDSYAPMVFHVVRKFVKDDELVEELAQQIFVKTYERLESFNRRSKFSSWLYVISMNHCRDYMKNVRRDNKNFSEMESYEIENLTMHSISPDYEMETKEINFILYDALQNITSDYAKAFLMKYNDGLSYKEMSNQLDVSVNALKQRVHRARAELREFMKHKM